jgi:phosphoglycolate phosphatase
MLQHVFWDWNGTLLDDAWLACSVINEIRVEMGMALIDMDFFRSVYQHPIRKVYDEMGFVLDDQQFAAISSRWMRRYVERLPEAALHIGAEDVLNFFRTRNISQHVLSAHNHQLLCEDVRNFGLDHFFERLSGLDGKVADSKVANGKKLFAEVDATPNTTLIIGDSSHDFEVAQALGCHCLLIASGAESEVRLRMNEAPVLMNIQEAQRYIEERYF